MPSPVERRLDGSVEPKGEIDWVALGRRQGRPSLRRRLAWAGVVLGATTVLLGAAFAYAAYRRADDGLRTFDSDIWIATDPDTDNTRLAMYQDLRANVPLQGLTEAELVELLGPPTRVNVPSQLRPSERAYQLGVEHIDRAWLIFSFDRDGLLVRFGAWRS